MYDMLQLCVEPRYNIYLGNTATLLKPFDELLSTMPKQYVFIIDDKLPKAWLERLLDECFISARKLLVIPFTAAEKNKSREMKIQIENSMLDSGFSKETLLIAIGGGTTLEVAGSVASTYYHGIACIYCPTTLLAMVDVSIEGKVSLSTPLGHNLIGSSFHPQGVFMNIDWLEMLSTNAFNEGMVETIKHSLIYDAHFFIWLNIHIESIKKHDPLYLFQLIKMSCAIKKAIIEKEKKEPSQQTLLHFGYTIGSAIKNASNNQLEHGQALALGLITEIYISQQLLGCNKILEKVYHLFSQLNINSTLPIPLDEQMIIQTLTIHGKYQNPFILLKDIGLACKPQEYTQLVSMALLRKALAQIAYF